MNTAQFFYLAMTVTFVVSAFFATSADALISCYSGGGNDSTTWEQKPNCAVCLKTQIESNGQAVYWKRTCSPVVVAAGCQSDSNGLIACSCDTNYCNEASSPSDSLMQWVQLLLTLPLLGLALRAYTAN